MIMIFSRNPKHRDRINSGFLDGPCEFDDRDRLQDCVQRPSEKSGLLAGHYGHSAAGQAIDRRRGCTPKLLLLKKRGAKDVTLCAFEWLPFPGKSDDRFQGILLGI